MAADGSSMPYHQNPKSVRCIQMAAMTPSIVISLDFEQRWGSQHRLGDDFDASRPSFDSVPDAVPALLELFTALNVRATWAVVGALACDSWDEYEHRAPSWPTYRDAALRRNPATRMKDPTGSLYFARALVEQIRRSSGQDLGSHSFSHHAMAEPGFTRVDAVADAAAMTKLFADRWSTRPRSFVFPRNQIAFEDVLDEAGIEIWRNNPHPFFWRANTTASQSLLVRGLRLLDGIAPLGTRVTTGPAASHFVRFNLPAPLWAMHTRRLAREAQQLRAGQHLHLWWHPHNLGVKVEQGIARARELLGALRDIAPGATRFASMADLIPS